VYWGRPQCWNSIVRGVIPLDRFATAHTKHNNDLETGLFLLPTFTVLHILGRHPFLSLNEGDISKDMITIQLITQSQYFFLLGSEPERPSNTHITTNDDTQREKERK
jgi:hypothetical protein